MNHNEQRLASLGTPAFEGAPLIVAEISGNHRGSLACMLEHIEAAAGAGADAVKIQTYTADTMTLDHDGPGFVIHDSESLWDGRSLYDLYEEAHTPWDWHGQIFEHARELGLACFSSPFDPTAVEFLEEFQPAAHKIASFELVDEVLLRATAETGRSVLASTGLAVESEIQSAVQTLRAAGCLALTLLKCTSAYPAPPEAADLLAIPWMQATFGTGIGLSDHTLGTTVAITSVALGVQVIEKHFVLDRADGAVDAPFSLEPPELKVLVDQTRVAHAALGKVAVGPNSADSASLQFRRSLYAVQAISAGEPFSRENVRSIRPGFGLHPKYLDVLLSRTAHRSYARGEPIEQSELPPEI
jgi:pseudaminic acid synthase